MSVKAINWAIERDLRPGPKLVLIVLANFADAEGFCYPSQATLARLTCQTERSVRSHLATLEAAGLIVRPRTQRRAYGGIFGTDSYQLQIGRLAEGDRRPRLGHAPAEESSAGDVRNSTAREENDSGGDGRKIPTARAESSAGPIENQTTEPSLNQQPGARAREANLGDEPSARQASTQAAVQNSTACTTEGEQTVEAFEAFRRAYPSRGSASNPWKPAREAFDRAIRQGVDTQSILDGVIGYAAAMAKSGDAGSKYVAQAQTFIRQRRWEQYEAAGRAARQKASPIASGDESIVNLTADCLADVADRWRRFVTAVHADQPAWAMAWLRHIEFDGTRPLARTQLARQEIDTRLGRFIEEAGFGRIEVAALTNNGPSAGPA